jgi:hypothetical protein
VQRGRGCDADPARRHGKATTAVNVNHIEPSMGAAIPTIGARSPPINKMLKPDEAPRTAHGTSTTACGATRTGGSPPDMP